MKGVARGADSLDMFDRRIAFRPRASVSEDAIQAKLLYPFFDAVVDQFGAMAFTRIKIA